MSDARRLIIEFEAEDELAEGIDWYEAQQPGLGAVLLQEVEHVLQELELGELIGEPARVWWTPERGCPDEVYLS